MINYINILSFAFQNITAIMGDAKIIANSPVRFGQHLYKSTFPSFRQNLSYYASTKMVLKVELSGPLLPFVLKMHIKKETQIQQYLCELKKRLDGHLDTQYRQPTWTHRCERTINPSRSRSSHMLTVRDTCSIGLHPHVFLAFSFFHVHKLQKKIHFSCFFSFSSK